MSFVAEGRTMLENQITFQEPKNHREEIKEEESWMRNLIRGNIEEESWRRTLGSIWKHLGSFLGTLRTS